MSIHERNTHATVQAGSGTVDLPWLSRDKLIQRVRYAARGNAVVEAFNAAGETDSVLLTADQKRVLLDELLAWAKDVTTLGLPPGIDDLLRALEHDLST
jgi:hypothetical protein